MIDAIKRVDAVFLQGCRPSRNDEEAWSKVLVGIESLRAVADAARHLSDEYQGDGENESSNMSILDRALKAAGR
jgi:hypothetical protein